MKHWIFAAALICFGSRAAQASPYFRLIDPSHPHKVVGAFLDPKDLGNTSAGTAIALVSHSVSDGCILPSIVCEDWAPALAGLSYNAGRFQFNVGPAVNLTPLAKRGLRGLLDLVTADETAAGVKALLSSQPISGPDVSASFGPALAVAPIEHGVILPFNQWRGKFRVFMGAAVKF
jgi:hypothetical protein